MRHLELAVILLAAAGLPAVLVSGGGEVETGESMNLVVISVDTLRYDRLGHTGYRRNTTPNIDRFSRRNTFFSNVWTTAPYTPSAHASLFTSLPVRAHGLKRFRPEEDSRLAASHNTLAEVLKKSGYETYAAVSSVNVGKAYNLDQGFQRFNSYPQPARKAYRTYREYLNMTGEKPFFIFLHYADPHIPYTRSERYRRKFLDGNNSVNIDPGTDYTRMNSRGYSQEETRDINALYDGEVRYADEYVGKAIRSLKRRGMYDNTVVVVTSDHGESLGKRGVLSRFGHVGFLAERVTKIPVIIHVPGKEPERIDRLASIRDIPVTVLELLDVEYPGYYSGINMFRQGREKVYTEAFSSIDSGMTAYRTRSRTVLYSGDRFLEIYDRDENEEEHLWKLSRQEIKRSIKSWRSSMEQKREKLGFRGEENYSDSIRKKLKALGYR